MNFVTTLFSQLGQVFNAQTAARKTLLLAVVMGSMVGMVMLTLYAQSGGYQVIYSNLTTKEAGEGLSKLSASNIQGRIENGGTAISVPASRKDEALILLMEEGISSSGTVGYEAMDKSTIGQSRRMEDRNYHRVREGELTRTLMSIQEIERARVHLALPENSMFVADEQKATASIALKLRNNTKLTDRQVSGIVHLVASSVENLQPQNVTIVDQAGNLLNTPSDQQGSQFSATQSEFKNQYEDNMKKRIESMIEKIVGPGKVVARVQTDFDFSTSREVRETFNPDEQDPIKRSETISQEGRSTEVKNQGGVGSSSNLPGSEAPAQATTGSSGNDSRMTQTAEYAVSRTFAETSSSVPTPNRVSVGILVDGIYEKATDAGGKETTTYRERTPEELTIIENMAKMAIGFDDKRLDQINVACSAFQVQELDEKPSFFNTYNFQRYMDLGIRWGVVALLGLLLIMMVLKPAVSGIMVSQLQGGQPLLAGAGAGAAHAGGGGAIGMDPALDSLPSALRATMSAPEGHSMADIPGRASLSAKDLLAQSNRFLDQVQGAGKEAQVLSKALQDEVLNNAKDNPEKTVSLMRNWMEEA